MEKKIAVLGTFDTKSEEYQYIIRQIQAFGVQVLAIDAGTRDTGALQADYTCREVAAWGGADYETLAGSGRAEGMAVMTRGATKLVNSLLEAGQINGLLSIGGSGGTTLATAVMRTLPVGFPKVMVTTQASSSKMPDFIGGKDIIVINSIVDVSGTNSIITRVYDQAAGAVVGAAAAYHPERHQSSAPRIAISMYGVTTPCVTCAAKYLQSQGYEPIIFHANGAGGRAMKTLIGEGLFVGVLDITTSEVAAYVLGSESGSAGADRLDAAVLAGIPQVISVGGMDVIGITVPELQTKFKGYQPYCHNDKPDMVRTKPEDNRKFGEFMCRSLNNNTAPCAVFLPMGGISSLDVPGGPTFDEEARRLLFESISLHAKPQIEVVEMDLPINDSEFALAMAKRLCEMLASRKEEPARL